MHNLIQGKVSVGRDQSRFKPYFLPHSIEMAGLTTIYGGDDRVYNNIIAGTGKPDPKQGLKGYDNDKFPLPVWLGGNVFYNQVTPSLKETGLHHVPGHNPEIQVVEKGGNTFLQLTLDPAYSAHKTKLIDTATLGKAKIPKAPFDAPDGSPIAFDTDYFGKKRDRNNVLAGPFTDLKAGKVVLKIWQETK